MSLDVDRALGILVEEIRARRWGEDSDLMQHAIEILILMRERVESLSAQNRELRAIVAKHLGKPLPKGDLS